MSSKKSYSAWGTFGFAAWDVVVDMHKETGSGCIVQMWPSSRRGVFVFEARATLIDVKGTERVIARVQAEYPNSREETLDAFLYTLVTKLSLCVDRKIESELGNAAVWAKGA